VINRKIVNTAIGRDVADSLAQYSLPVLASAVSQRVLFAEAASQGKAVFEIDPDGTAAREIEAVVAELKEI